MRVKRASELRIADVRENEFGAFVECMCACTCRSHVAVELDPYPNLAGNVRVVITPVDGVIAGDVIRCRTCVQLKRGVA